MATRTASRLAILALCLTIVLMSATVASACPSCRQALGAADGAQGDLARGIYYSVMFMLTMPFAIVGTFGCMAYRAVKREQRRIAEQEARNSKSEPAE
jgi:heme/copper-type cytochrome/quinol oxidase subunit 2